MPQSVLNLVILAGFVIAAIAGIAHHEIWLDEAHHWLLARDSENLVALWSNTRYEGHPVFWNLLLFLITRLTTDVSAMQALNVAIATSAIAVFLWSSPFATWQKVLFVSGYFMLYEYTVISRNYALVLFFLFLSVNYYTKRKYLALGFSLALLCNVHAFGMIFSALIPPMIAVDWMARYRPRMRKEVYVGLIIFALGFVLALLQVIPPTDSILVTNAQETSIFERLGRSSTIFLKGLAPIPDPFNYRMWNTNLLMAISKPLCVVLSLLLFLIPLYIFRKRREILVFFYGSALLLLLFVFVTDLQAARYYGAAFIALTTCVWVYSSGPYAHMGKESGDEGNRQGRQVIRFFNSILVLQACAGVTIYSVDMARPFSGSREAAELMLNDPTVNIYVSGGCGAAPVAAYLGVKVYFLGKDEYGSFCISNRDPKDQIITSTELKEAALAYALTARESAFLIAHRPLDLTADEQQYIKPYGQPAKSMLRNERYHIYTITGTGSFR